jgi:cell division protein FtsL
MKTLGFINIFLALIFLAILGLIVILVFFYYQFMQFSLYVETGLDEINDLNKNVDDFLKKIEDIQKKIINIIGSNTVQ